MWLPPDGGTVFLTMLCSVVHWSICRSIHCDGIDCLNVILFHIKLKTLIVLSRYEKNVWADSVFYDSKNVKTGSERKRFILLSFSFRHSKRAIDNLNCIIFLTKNTNPMKKKLLTIFGLLLFQLLSASILFAQTICPDQPVTISWQWWRSELIQRESFPPPTPDEPP